MNENLVEANRIELVICDDHLLFAKGLAMGLEAEGDFAIVGLASSADQALRLVRDKLPDVVVMDIYMPNVDGIEATRQICSLSASTRVVMLTVSDRNEDLIQALRAGATGYVLKNRQASEIASTIRAVHRGDYTFPASLAGELLRELGRDSDQLSQLNDEEKEILAGLARGESDQIIARRLLISERTFRRRLLDIRSRLFLASRLEAAVFAAKHGLVSRGIAGEGLAPTNHPKRLGNPLR